jgi:hypothetical protein
MRIRRLVALGKIGLKELQPDIFAGVSLRAGMAKSLSRDFEPALNIVVQASQELGQGPLAHVTISFQFLAPRAEAAAALILFLSGIDRSSETMLFVLAGSTMRAI